MKHYRVSPNGSIIHPRGGRGMWMPGDVIREGDLPEDKIKEHLRSGYLLPHNAPDDPLAVPGSVASPAIPHETEMGSKKGLQTSGGPTQAGVAESLRVDPSDTTTTVSMRGVEPPPSLRTVSKIDLLKAQAEASSAILPPAPQQVLEIDDEGKPVVRDARPGEPVPTAEGDLPAGSAGSNSSTTTGFAAISPWVFGVSELEGKSLTDLNILIQERDSKIQPFETVEEAIAFLSQDHGKAK